LKKNCFLISAAGLLLAVLLQTGVLRAETFSFELMTGDAYNVPTLLDVRQNGYPDIEIPAQYDTKPFGPYAPYYSWRAALWDKDEAWEFVQLHQRIFLVNTTPEVNFFAIHFGYNFFMVGHAWRRNGFIFHLDGGVLITNPQNTIRGQVLNTYNTGILDQGYDFSGFGAQAAVSRPIYFFHNAYINLELGLSSGWATVPVVNGTAYAPNIAIHGRVGMGFRL
jgi:hypothetical protein